MPSDISVEPSPDSSRAQHQTSRMLACVAIVALIGNCLLNSPSRFSEKHLADASLLKPVVDTLALWGMFPTARGVEIRSLVFFLGAAALAIITGLRLALATTHNRLSLDDLLEVRDRAASPYLWWILLIAVSWLSSVFSHAPEVCQGQTIARMLQLAWWWPLAAMLTPCGVRLLAVGLVVSLTLTSGIGLWYHAARVLPDLPGARLQYPIGNELWLAACLLPGGFVGAGLAASAFRKCTDHGTAARSDVTDSDVPRRTQALPVLLLIAVVIILGALALTRSRSAAAGFVAGLFVVLAILAPVRRRLHVVLGMLVLGISGAILMQTWRESGSTGQRAHSIRARLDYEWPYAIRLFLEKPIAGNGDGAYALLAGQFAREDQLDDPNVMRFDEQSWLAHAHNEFLELLSDVGIVGAAAFALALLLPLYRALQFCDRRRGDPSAASDRLLLLGLAGALAASIVEACGTPSIREPGALPILLTVWASLWAMVRSEAPSPRSAADEKPLAGATVRLFGVVVCVAALALGFRAVQDWRAMRSRFEASRLMGEGEFAEASRQADFAAVHALDPFQHTLSDMLAVWARSLQFDARLAADDRPSSREDLELSAVALARLNRLNAVAPRFLRLATLEAGLELNRARAYERREELVNVRHCQERFVLALRQARRDDPFLMERVEQLWAVDGGATMEDRLLWLRCLLRGGEVSPRFVQMAQQLLASPGIESELQKLMTIATDDAERPPREWRDRLSPETLRLAALALQGMGRPQDAIQQLQLAQSLYAAAGPRLFAGHAAAIHEEVRYRFSLNPLAELDENLDRLAQAFSIAYGRADRSTILPDRPLGRTRARILLVAGREQDALAQLRRIESGDDLVIAATLAGMYRELASAFANAPAMHGHVFAWLDRLRGLKPGDMEAERIASHVHLQNGNDELAIASLQRLLGAADQGELIEVVLELRRRFPDSPVWPDLEREDARLRAGPSTSQPG